MPGRSGVGWGRQPATTATIGTSTQRHLATRIAASYPRRRARLGGVVDAVPGGLEIRYGLGCAWHTPNCAP